MKPTFARLGAALCSLFVALNHAGAQGAAFTYQGRLNDTASPASGSYDLTFALFPTKTGSSPIGNIITNSQTTLTEGLFTVTLDFGANFPGADRWLEIGVRSNGASLFATLSPRQKLTPEPYAITAENLASGAGLSGSYSGPVTINNSANQFSGTFTGNGGGITNLPNVSSVIVGRHFGAVGDGIADDTLALQAAIDAANDQTNTPAAGYSPGRTELRLEAGLYKTTAPLWIRGQNGLKISGTGGKGQCIISNSASDLFIITNAANPWAQEPNDLAFENLSLRSCGYTRTALRFVATINTTDGVLVRDVDMRGFGKCIFCYGDIGEGGLGGVSNARFENLDLFDNNFGIVATNGLFNANLVDGIFACNYGAAFVINSGEWDISVHDSGGIFASTTTNLLWITSNPKIILRGGQCEYYGGGSNSAAIWATGGGGYDLTCDGVTLNDYSGGQSWGGKCWSVALEDTGTFASFAHFNDCRFSIANRGYSAFPFVKITHSDSQRVIANGPRVVAAFFNSGFYYTSLLLQADPIVTVNNAANILGQGSIFWGFKQWIVTNGIPKLFMATATGLLRVDASDSSNAGNLTSGTLPDARLSANVARLNASQSFAADANFSTKITVGGFFCYAPTVAAPANNTTLTPVSSYVRLIQSGGAVTLNAASAIANGVSPGTVLVLEGTSDVNTVTIPNAAHTRLASGQSRKLGLRDILTLLWNGTDWLELSYTNN